MVNLQLKAGGEVRDLKSTLSQWRDVINQLEKLLDHIEIKVQLPGIDQDKLVADLSMVFF